MSSSPEVSIGMPVYNAEDYIREAIDSLLNQSFQDFELIISDNASIDGTGEICRAYMKEDKRVRYIRQQTNIGVIENFQFVLNEAKGQYFMWAAGDDIWDERWIELLLASLKKSGKEAAFGRLLHIDENSLPFPHPANSQEFEYIGSRLNRRTKFFLADEGMGKANLFYSLYCIESVKKINLIRFKYDFHILFDLLCNVEYMVVSSTCMKKRIHKKGLGEVKNFNVNMRISEQMKRLLKPVWILFQSMFLFSPGYFKTANFYEYGIFALLFPVRSLLSLSCYFKRKR
jgi:glycosyltransferase involved in cell wall biosynthesis